MSQVYILYIQEGMDLGQLLLLLYKGDERFVLRRYIIDICCLKQNQNLYFRWNTFIRLQSFLANHQPKLKLY
ncbi:hypothetical protein DC20_20180 [Rufibacter tibetensis]|uniref:Uncharacterized protein n=1 Tax=Rufibacter tibetensis TaxID=512763 RepID=A0A0N7HX27_9BACT|nr:hypothetical protein DC20_20180 [Rufibacter tibetensis]